MKRLDLDALLERVDLGLLIDRVDIGRVLAALDLNVIVGLVNALMTQIDLNAVVNRIDVNQIVAKVDLNAVLERVDMDASSSACSSAPSSRRPAPGWPAKGSTPPAARASASTRSSTAGSTGSSDVAIERRAARRCWCPRRRQRAVTDSSAPIVPERDVSLQGTYAGIMTRLGGFAIDIVAIAAIYALAGHVVDYIVSALRGEPFTLEDAQVFSAIAARDVGASSTARTPSRSPDGRWAWPSSASERSARTAASSTGGTRRCGCWSSR